jgi:hypothetical protein
MRNVSDKSCRENQNKPFVSGNIFFNRADYEKIWKNNVQRSSLNMTKVGMRISCWISKAIDTQSEYVINFAFPL